MKNVLIAVFVSTILSACSIFTGNESTVAPVNTYSREGGSMTPNSILKMYWNLDRVQYGQQSSQAKLKTGYLANRYTISFTEQGGFHLSGGCNNGNGMVTVKASDQISFSDMHMTKKGCERALMNSDSEVSRLLKQASAYQLVDDNQLVLAGSDSKVFLKGILTNEAKFGQQGMRKFIEVRNTPKGVFWREAKYNKAWVQVNKQAPWLSGEFPGIEGFYPEPETVYTVRIKAFQDESTGKEVWVKDMITMSGVLD